MSFIGFYWLGFLVSFILLFGVLYSTIGFTGMKKEKYSIFNHFISELGDPRFSAKKNIFALTLIFSGSLMIFFSIGLGFLLHSIWGDITLFFGVVSSIFSILVGIFPEDKEQTHFALSGFYFITLFIYDLVFTLTIIFQPNLSISHWVIIVNIITMVLAFIFIIDTLILDKEELALTYRPWEWENGRPRFWLNPFLEWLTFFGIIAWILNVSIACI